mgnify:CR=1 FL=1
MYSPQLRRLTKHGYLLSTLRTGNRLQRQDMLRLIRNTTRERLGKNIGVQLIRVLKVSASGRDRQGDRAAEGARALRDHAAQVHQPLAEAPVYPARAAELLRHQPVGDLVVVPVHNGNVAPADVGRAVHASVVHPNVVFDLARAAGGDRETAHDPSAAVPTRPLAGGPSKCSPNRLCF